MARAAAAVRDALGHGKPVPLTDGVRMSVERVDALVRDLRAAAAR